VLEFGHEKNAVRVGECMDVDGISDLCRERFEREYLSLRKRLSCDSFRSGFRLLDKVIRTKLCYQWRTPPGRTFLEMESSTESADSSVPLSSEEPASQYETGALFRFG
jgi:hypothetical protein